MKRFRRQWTFLRRAVGWSASATRVLLIAVVTVVASCGSALTDVTGVSGDWATATPRSQGLDPDVLDAFAGRLEDGEFGKVNSLLVVRNGFLVYERYFRGAQQDDIHTMYSVSKSVTSLLIGMAIERGLIDDVTRPLLSFFPEYEETDIAHMSEDKRRMTLEHVLQMRTGIEWDEWSTPYTTPTNPTTHLFQSEDWMKFMLDRPLASPPGTSFTYNSGATMLLSGVLRNVTGGTAAAFAEQVLLGPLGIEAYAWQEGPSQINNTGWGLSLRPQDMAKLGFLFLQDGVWEGERLLSRDWIDASVRRYSEFNGGGGYGYQWWLDGPVSLDGRSARVPSARGWGGQFIVVIDELDVVAVATGENFEGGGLSPGAMVSQIVRATG